MDIDVDRQNLQYELMEIFEYVISQRGTCGLG